MAQQADACGRGSAYLFFFVSGDKQAEVVNGDRQLTMQKLVKQLPSQAAAWFSLYFSAV